MNDDGKQDAIYESILEEIRPAIARDMARLHRVIGRPYEFSGNPPCSCPACLAAEAAGMLGDARAAWRGAKTP